MSAKCFRCYVGMVLVVFGLTWAGSSAADVFTLEQLAAGNEFTIGSLRFFDWSVDADSSIDPATVSVKTNDDPAMPGFMVDFELSVDQGGENELLYLFSIESTNAQPIINFAEIEILDSTLNKFTYSLDGQLEPPNSFFLTVSKDDQSEVAFTFEPIDPAQASVPLLARLETTGSGRASYATKFQTSGSSVAKTGFLPAIYYLLGDD